MRSVSTICVSGWDHEARLAGTLFPYLKQMVLTALIRKVARIVNANRRKLATCATTQMVLTAFKCILKFLTGGNHGRYDCDGETGPAADSNAATHLGILDCPVH